MDFQTVDQHVAAVDLDKLKAHDHATATANFCQTYKAVKPILQLVENFPFFPAKWKAVVTQFLATVDILCP